MKKYAPVSAPGFAAALFLSLPSPARAQIQRYEGALLADWEKPSYVVSVEAEASSASRATVATHSEVDDDGAQDSLDCFSLLTFDLGWIEVSRSDGKAALRQRLSLVLEHKEVRDDVKAACPDYDFSGDLKSKLRADSLRSGPAGYAMLSQYFHFTFAFKEGTVWLEQAVQDEGIALSRSGSEYLLSGFDLGRIGLGALSLGDPWADANPEHLHTIPLQSAAEKRQARAAAALPSEAGALQALTEF